MCVTINNITSVVLVNKQVHFLLSIFFKKMLKIKKSNSLCSKLLGVNLYTKNRKYLNLQVYFLPKIIFLFFEINPY